MKKNFFKKLSFVLALAMIVTALAPAAGAFAATKAPKLNAKEKTLFLSVDGKDEFDFNISNKKDGWKYLWTSANENVVTVNKKNGVVVATGAGKAKVSVVITDKKGEEIDELTATVLVRDNIKELTITNLPKDNKVAVGVAHDFNRSYKTVAGLTKGSQAITRWTVSPSEKATISDAGVFTATEAGEYTITANAFQSKAKYTSWLADSTKYASYVTATATYKVTVEASMVSASQLSLKKFDVVFNTAMTKADVEKNLTVSYMAGTAKLKELVKGISMSTDGKTATVEMYVDFTKGSTYVVDYTGMTAVQFVAATTKPEDVVDIAILTTTAEIGKKKTVEVALYNKDKVNLAGDANLSARVVLEKKDNNTVTLDGKDLYMYKVGDTVNLTATYHTYNWVDGKEVGNLTAAGIVTCVEQSKANVGTLNAYTVAASVPSNFKDPKHTMFKQSSPSLYVELKGVDANGDELLTNNKPGNTAGTWKYVSSNSNVLLVDPTSGAVYGVTEGTAVVVVYLNDVNVAACEITVTGARKAAIATLDTNSINLSKTINQNSTVGLKVKDQLGDDYANFTATVKSNNETTASKALINKTTSADPSATAGVVLNAFNVEAGTYFYSVTIVDGVDSNNKFTVQLTVTVQDPGSADVAYYRVEPTKSIYDLKDDSSISLAVYGYTAGGTKKVLVANPSTDLSGLSIAKSDGTAATVAWSGSTGTINLASAAAPYAVSGTSVNVVALQATGTYTIKATSVSGATVNVSPVVFEIKNTRDAVKVTQNKLYAADGKTSVLDAINDCFDFSIGDGSYEVLYYGLTGSTNYGVAYTKLQNGNQIAIDYLYIYEPITGTNNFYAHKVDMNDVVITLGK